MTAMKFKNNGKGAGGIDRRLSVAPMMDWTDRHCRFFHRQLAPSALLFTEMVTAEAILHAGADRFCRHDDAEHPVALQLGGSDPDRLAQAVEAVAGFEFDEINLNIGCPSPRVQSGSFGACLMAEPELVARCVDKMALATDRPVTVKCRIGIDDMDEEAGLNSFVDAVASAGVTVIYLHARKAWLSGLSPKENREIPPLNYQRAERLAADYPALDIVLNGGLCSVDDMCDATQSGQFAGVMIGRAGYKTPMVLADVSCHMSGMPPIRLSALADIMTAYAEQQMAQGVALHAITRHMLGLCAGMRGAKQFRRKLGEEARLAEASASLIAQTIEQAIIANERSVA